MGIAKQTKTINKMDKINYMKNLMKLSIITGLLIFYSCGGNNKQNNNSSQQNNSYSGSSSNSNSVPQAVKETYNLIKNKTFEGTIHSEQQYLSIIKLKQRLTFNPTNEVEGEVIAETRYEEASAATDGGVKKESNTGSYFITEDGKIVIGNLILERFGTLKRNLKANIEDNYGLPVVFSQIY